MKNLEIPHRYILWGLVSYVEKGILSIYIEFKILKFNLEVDEKVDQHQY